MCDSWEPVKAVCGPTGRPSTLHTTVGWAPVSNPHRHPTAVWQNLHSKPKTSLRQETLDDRCVDTGQVMGPGPRRPTIVSRKMLSADDPAACTVVVQSHPYESGSDLRTQCLCSSQTNRALHRHILQRAERAHRRERGGREYILLCSSVCSVSPPLVTGQTKLLLELLRISTKSCDNENRRNGHLLKRIKSWGI